MSLAIDVKFFGRNDMTDENLTVVPPSLFFKIQ